MASRHLIFPTVHFGAVRRRVSRRLVAWQHRRELELYSAIYRQTREIQAYKGSEISEHGHASSIT